MLIEMTGRDFSKDERQFALHHVQEAIAQLRDCVPRVRVMVDEGTGAHIRVSLVASVFGMGTKRVEADGKDLHSAIESASILLSRSLRDLLVDGSEDIRLREVG